MTLIDGIVLIDKNESETSFEVVKTVRKTLKIKKVGHTGTLDPFASGLLIVLLGQGTKLSSYIMPGEKRYLATIRLGIETDTMDPEGQIVRIRKVPELAPLLIEKRLRSFIGEIEQVPPVFSALKYKGKRAYEFARSGIPIELEKRKVKILDINIISILLPDICLEVTCSAGTYIRSFASDLGKKLGTGAHLKSLRRISSGPFHVKDALMMKGMDMQRCQRLVLSRMIPLTDAIPRMRSVMVHHTIARKIRNGYQPLLGELFPESVKGRPLDSFFKVVNDKDLVAIGQVHRSKDIEKVILRRVFH